MTIKQIRQNINMTQAEFAEYFKIPLRTVQNWELRNGPAEYVVELIKYKVEKERLDMLKLIEKDHGEIKVLKEGTVKELIDWLKENDDIYTWILDEDPDAEMPDFQNIETLKQLECELKIVDLDWWTLEVIGV